MKQTKLESLLESSANTFIAFFISLLFWAWVIVPLFNLPSDHKQNLAITGMFTVLSVVRSYLLRRFFNAGLHKAIKRFVMWKKGLAVTLITDDGVILVGYVPPETVLTNDLINHLRAEYDVMQKTVPLWRAVEIIEDMEDVP